MKNFHVPMRAKFIFVPHWHLTKMESIFVSIRKWTLLWFIPYNHTKPISSFTKFGDCRLHQSTKRPSTIAERFTISVGSNVALVVGFLLHSEVHIWLNLNNPIVTRVKKKLCDVQDCLIHLIKNIIQVGTQFLVKWLGWVWKMEGYENFFFFVCPFSSHG